MLIATIQAKLLLPQEYIIWTFKYPFSVSILIYEVYIIFGFFYAFNKSFRKFIILNFKKGFIKKHRKPFLSTFIILNIILIYTILFDVTVINGEDERFIIEKLDIQYVNMGIHKVSSIDNFEYCTEDLDKIYTDKIRNILLNIK